MKSDRGFSRRDLLRLSAGAAIASTVPVMNTARLEAQSARSAAGAFTGVGGLNIPPGNAFRRVTLEMSLKPFRDLSRDAIRRVCEEVFTSWAPLLRRCDGCAVMLWASDGSEILDYGGRMDDAFDWARYLGIANPPATPSAGDPERKSAHSRNWLYVSNPPRMTYEWLRTIVATLKSVGHEMTGKPISIGATFDPGPEFAYSDFKYHRHPEIARDQMMGINWVNCTSTLKADTRTYAAYPNGIPEGTPFSEFFGRQSDRFLTDLGYDYIWFSNGFGFSLSPWNVTGPLFDGKLFDNKRAQELREAILSFWRGFRKGCPHFPIETRGSNMIVGADLATSGSPILDIYRGGFNIVAPPNSPWAALDGDVGLEIVGYLSRIAELPPGDVFPFRYYIHDPWWMNSPWLDRYGREPYDIYLPLSLARVSGEAKVTRPAYLEFLTIDNSYGQMPEKVPSEVTPLILDAMENYSDAPGLVTWIYPFDEYNEMTFGASPRLGEVFFGDWFLRNAVNDGFPLNSVVSTRQFAASLERNPDFYRETVLLVYAPVVNGDLEKHIESCLRRGVDVFLYGPIDHLGSASKALLGVRKSSPLPEGELTLKIAQTADTISHGHMPLTVLHRNTTSAGPIDTVLQQQNDKNVRVCATVSSKNAERVVALSRSKALGEHSGSLAWVRGSFSCSVTAGKQLPQSDDPARYFPGGMLMRLVLSEFGYSIRLTKPVPETRSPLLLVSRKYNGFILSGYTPDMTVGVRLRFPHGAPVAVGTETWLEDGQSTYTLPRTWHKEVRCMVDQTANGTVSCIEGISELPSIERRLILNGLKDATVHFYPENGREVSMTLVNRAAQGPRPVHYVQQDSGKRLVAHSVTGELTISW